MPYGRGTGYYRGNPSQYYAGREQSREQKFQQLLNMVMMMKQMGQGQEQQKWERGMEEKKFGSLDEFRKAQIKDWDKPPAPLKPSVFAEKVSALVRDGGMTRSQAVRLVNNADKEPLAFMKERDALIKIGHNPKVATELAILGRPPRPPQTPQGQQASKTSQEGWRRSNRKDTESAFASIQNTDASILTDPEKIKQHQGFGLHLDVPVQYSISQRNIRDNIADEHDKTYVAKVDFTKQKFMELLDALQGYIAHDGVIPPSWRSQIDKPTWDQLVKTYSKKKSKVSKIIDVIKQ